MLHDKNQYTKENRLYGYVIIDPEGDVLDGLNEDGSLHFTPQYMLEELDMTPMVFENRLRLPRNITDKLSSGHGLMEVRLNERGKADADAVLNGRVIGSVGAVLDAAHFTKTLEKGGAFASKQDMRDMHYRDKHK